MNKMVRSLLKYVPNDQWILTQSHLPWLKLQLSIPTNEILREANTLYESAIEHRSNDNFAEYQHQGWKALTIFGHSSSTTTDSDHTFQWTDIADQCPVTVDFIKQHWIIDHTTKRIRFMWLDPGGFILPHNDRDARGFYETNIAIEQPDDCKFRFLDYGTVPFESGSAYMVDISQRHLVVNMSNQVRTHMIVHAQLKPGLLKQSYEQNFYS